MLVALTAGARAMSELELLASWVGLSLRCARVSPALTAFGFQSWSLCRLPRTRQGSTCHQVCGTGPAAVGSPCSPTAEVRQ